MLFFAGIGWLFLSERDPNVQTSKALWLPVTWLVLAVTASKWLSATWGHRATMVDTQAFMTSTTEGNPIERNIFTVLLLIGIVVLAKRGRPVSTFISQNWPFVLFFGYCLFSVAWSDYSDVAFKRWIKALGDVVMVTIVLTDEHRAVAVKRFVAWTGFLLVPLSVLYMEFYPEVGRQVAHAFEHVTVKFVGVTDDKNMLGVIGLLFGLGSLWRVLQAIREKQGTRLIAAHGVMLGMTFWIFFRANSMTAFGTFLLASALIVTTSVPLLARKRLIVHMVAVTVITLAVVALFFNAGGGMVESLGRDPTLTGRTELWTEVLRMNPNPLLGAGFESFWMGGRLSTIWDHHWWHPNEAHNGYIEVYLNLGWIGVSLLALLITTGYRNAFAMFNVDREVGGLRLTFFVMGLLYSCSEAGFRLLNPVWICFMLGSLAVCASQAHEVVEVVPIPATDIRRPRRQVAVPAYVRPSRESVYGPEAPSSVPVRRPNGKSRTGR